MADPTNEQAYVRRLARKRFNEHVKLLSSFVNTLSLAILGAALVIPLVSTGEVPSVNVIWISVGFALHLLAQTAIRLLRSED